MTDTSSPSFDENANTPVQMDSDAVAEHGGATTEPDDFLNDAVSGSESTSDATPQPLGHANDVHPDLEVSDDDLTDSDGPVIEGGDAGASTPSPDQV